MFLMFSTLDEMASHLPNFEDTPRDFKGRTVSINCHETQKVSRSIARKHYFGCVNSNSEAKAHHLTLQNEPSLSTSNSCGFSSCQRAKKETDLMPSHKNEFYNLNRYWLHQDFKRSFQQHKYMYVEHDNITNKIIRHHLYPFDSDENGLNDNGMTDSLILYPWMRTQHGLYLCSHYIIRVSGPLLFTSGKHIPVINTPLNPTF